MSRKKQEIHFEDEPIDKVEHFMAANFKKMLAGLAGLLVLFLIVYTVNKMNASKKEMLVSKAGQLEMMADLSGEQTKVDEFLKMADELPDSGDYINLKVAEMLIDKKKTKEAETPLKTAGGEFKELADSLRYDTGMQGIDPKQYFTGGRLSSVWYYRACLAASGEEKTKLMAEFEKSFPESELLKQLKRWNG